MKRIVDAVIVKNENLTDNIYDMTINAPAVAKEAAAGMFLELYTGRADTILPRPISICEIDKTSGNIRMVYQAVGKGTNVFSEMKQGANIRVLGSCGNGYTIKECSRSILVGGGIGVPPLLETIKSIDGEKIVVLGFRSNSILIDEFKKYADELYIATDDGSEGFKGNVVDLMKSINLTGDIIYSCGPKIMLKNLAVYAQENNIECQVSMEERMACGIGACVGCAVKIKYNDTWCYKKVCKDGPVFDAKEVIWE